MDYPITDVLQMMGRAGRPQFDTEGVACVLVHDVKKNYYKKFLYEPFPVESSLHKQLPDNFNAEIDAGNLKTVRDVFDYLSWTFFYRRLMNNPSYYGLYSDKLEDFQRFLLDLILSVLRELEQSKCIQLTDDQFIKPLPLGHIASFYYVSHKTVRFFSDELFTVETVPELLALISRASEYDPAPLRHNENNEVEEFARNLYWPVESDMSFDDAHTKVFVLLQAFMLRLPLPVTDFLNDQNSIMDNSIRLINALIDIAAYLKLWNQFRLLLECMPYLIQAFMPYDSELVQLDGVNPAIAKRLRKEGVTTLRQLREEVPIEEAMSACRVESSIAAKVGVLEGSDV